MKADRRAQSARPRGMSLANSLREAKGGACPPFLRSYALADSQHKTRFPTSVRNDKRCCHFDRREKSPAQGIIELPRIIVDTFFPNFNFGSEESWLREIGSSLFGVGKVVLG